MAVKIPRWLGSALLILSPLLVVLVAHGRPPALTWAYAAFLMGTFVELLVLAGSAKEAGIIAALALSLAAPLALFPEAVAYWPMAFAILVLLFAADHFRRTLLRIGEGNALLASLALVAWMLDRYLSGSGGALALALTVLPTLFTLAHALTFIPLTRGTRFLMSLWTAVVVAALSIRYFRGVMGLGAVEDQIARGDWGEALSVFVEFLLMGASGPILVRNALLIVPYIPGRGFDQNYRERVDKATAELIERISTDQVAPQQAVVALLIAAALIAVQRIRHLVSIDFVMWFLLAGVPWIMTAWMSLTLASSKPARASR